MNNMEEQLWNYIDGTCTTDEEQAIRHLIDTDETYRLKYAELMQLHAEFANIELDEPSMAFTYNVMEAIRTENALKPLKSAINKRIIQGIAGFFILSILVLLTLVLANINWQSPQHASGALPVHLKLPQLQQMMTGNIMRGFIMFDVVLVLFLLDAWLRKKTIKKQAL